ncbi:hypothetical protein DPEC_G00240470 [Dallia pectoralis]|uniref:Uncharacterized protein n=1 Tax=Dallia pectoralis TaxID=75939 RepID=A0ACC2FZM5_DALPE|nr:hypothetical protein DPEC_G00240470 [Dallia pectoralis]
MVCFSSLSCFFDHIHFKYVFVSMHTGIKCVQHCDKSFTPEDLSKTILIGFTWTVAQQLLPECGQIGLPFFITIWQVKEDRGVSSWLSTLVFCKRLNCVGIYRPLEDRKPCWFMFL